MCHLFFFLHKLHTCYKLTRIKYQHFPPSYLDSLREFSIIYSFILRSTCTSVADGGVKLTGTTWNELGWLAQDHIGWRRSVGTL